MLTSRWRQSTLISVLFSNFCSQVAVLSNIYSEVHLATRSFQEVSSQKGVVGGAIGSRSTGFPSNRPAYLWLASPAATRRLNSADLFRATESVCQRSPA
jgi:hypothetical protein